MARQRDDLFSGVVPMPWRLFKDADLPWIRLKYAPRYRGLRILMIIAIFVAMASCVLLVAKGRQDKPWPDKNLLIRFSTGSGSGPIAVSTVGKTTWTKSYDVEFAPGEELLAVAELHQPGHPVQPLGQKTFTGSTDPRRLTISFTRNYKDDARTVIGYSVKVHLGEQVFEIPQFRIGAKGHLNGEVLNWFQGGELRRQRASHKTTDETSLARLLSYRLVRKNANVRGSASAFGISSGVNHRIVLKMIPTSRLKRSVMESIGSLQALDGRIITANPKQPQNGKGTPLTKPDSEKFWHVRERNLASSYE
ncbi:MAG: hypothetical protein ACYS76_09250 [Planctomycetota bacterium]|jgi:hypothetical protein